MQMQDDQVEEPLPPLDRPGVAPLWRLIAVFSLIAVAGLLVMVIILFVALAQQPTPFVNNGWAVPPAMAVGGGAVADLPDDPPDGANPPYPVKQDLRPAGTFPLPGEGEVPPEQQESSPRQTFLDARERVEWTNPDPEVPDRVLVSPTGDNMAYAKGAVLMAGPFGAANPVGQNVPGGPMRPGVMGPGGMVRVAPGGVPAQPPRPQGPGPRAVVCGWFDDSTVVWVNAGGKARENDIQKDLATTFPESVEAALLLPGGQSLVAVRRERQAKGDGKPAHDLTSVSILPPAGGAERPTVLVPAGLARWHSPALAPDGKRLAIVSDRDEKPGRWRVFLLSLEGNEPKPEPVSPPAARVEGVCWAPDGKALVYARSLTTPPGDHAPGTPKDACDLFLLDLETKKETRLSRGGGFTSPSLTREGVLFFLARTGKPDAPGASLVKMTLKTARDFAGIQEERERERTNSWKDLADVVLKKAGVPAGPDGGETLPAGAQKKIADAFAQVYPVKFNKADPPTTAAALERQRQEVAALDLAPPEQARFVLLLGAVEGEYLRGRQEGLDWHSTKELGGGGAVSAENPFGFAFNPFRPLRGREKADKDESPQSLAEVLYRAEGRPIVLSNDSGSAKDALDHLIDPDLARGTELLKQNKGDAADGVLLEMANRHPGNHALTLHVGSLLQRHGRIRALHTLLRPRLTQLHDDGVLFILPKNARLFNLVGLALLATEAKDDTMNLAMTAFQAALRCDLNYGPAYLNLAEAYWRLQRLAEARACLRRYLKLFPDGEWAEDARRRLTVAGDE